MEYDCINFIYDNKNILLSYVFLSNKYISLNIFDRFNFWSYNNILWEKKVGLIIKKYYLTLVVFIPKFKKVNKLNYLIILKKHNKEQVVYRFMISLIF